MAARCKSHIRIYINEGNNVTTAKEMKTALLSHGGLEGVRVAVVETTSSSQEHQKITGINKLNNFKRMEGGLVAWRAYGIGTGKLINFEGARALSGVGIKWLSQPFSEGTFRSVHKERVSPAIEPSEQHQSPVFSCPQSGCVRIFQSASALDHHLSLEACTQAVERKTLMDLAKEGYAERIKEGVGAIPTLQHMPADEEDATCYTSSLKQEGWALKESKKGSRFNESQKAYLESKFTIGLSTGRKLDADDVAHDMRHARNQSGERLFQITEFLTPQQVSSFFSRLSSRAKQQQNEGPLNEYDINAVIEETNFSEARENVLSTLHLQHPIVVDQYNICDLVRGNTLKSLKENGFHFKDSNCRRISKQDIKSAMTPVRTGTVSTVPQLSSLDYLGSQ
ncbi:hypothetical protein QZH41_002280 [Actinostola sp. cb2023]|nr:hypothetical protein QZH41_002280 [Actinostola sp. cb2023]